jgi:hypothetical protein
MLSVPTRWISSAAKRDLPSPKARKSVSSGHDVPMTDSFVDPTPTIHADPSSDQKSSLKKRSSSAGEDSNSQIHDEGKGRLVDYSV